MTACVGCGDESTTDHHTSYHPEETVRVCNICHWRIHHEPGFRDDLEPAEARPPNYESDEKGTLSARLPQWLIDAADDLADDFGDNRTGVVRTALAEYVADHQPDADRTSNLPDDETLREGYLRLRDAADPDTGLVPTSSAASKVAQKVGVKSDEVRRTVLKPLERRGYLEPRWGKIRVVAPERAAGGSPAVRADGGEEQ